MTVVPERSGGRWPSAGLIAGPGAWIVATQLNYALAPHMCGSAAYIVAGVAAILVLIALGGAALSWSCWKPRSLHQALFSAANGRVRFFVAGLGVLSGVLFAIVVAMQGTAALMLDGCLR